MAVVLVVDDNESMREVYCTDLRRIGKFETRESDGVDAALTVLAEEWIDCILLDLEMPKKDGFALLDAMRKLQISIPTIVYTAKSSYQNCLEAIRRGAIDFIGKEVPIELAIHQIEAALEGTRLSREVARLKRRVGESTTMIGRSVPFQRMCEEINRFAPRQGTVLLFGESGSGKSLAARAVHEQSGRKGPYLHRPLGALPNKEMIASEVAGHMRGAFTGAEKDRAGCFELARGGTLLLDDIHCMPMDAQAVLLSILDDKVVTRIGGSRSIPVDVRIVVATNRDLKGMVEEGTFLADLYYRVKGLTIRIPPLRERAEDIPLLAAHFVETICRSEDFPPKRLSPAALETLTRAEWRGNVRELEAVIRWSVLASGGDRIEVEHLPLELRAGGGEEVPTTDVSAGRSFKDQVHDAERRIILAALERNGSHIEKTAADLQMADRASLRRAMIRLGVWEGRAGTETDPTPKQ